MTQNGISYVLNASNSCPKPDFICESRFMRIPINDNYCEKLLPWLDKSIEFIGERRDVSVSMGQGGWLYGIGEGRGGCVCLCGTGRLARGKSGQREGLPLGTPGFGKSPTPSAIGRVGVNLGQGGIVQSQSSPGPPPSTCPQIRPSCPAAKSLFTVWLASLALPPSPSPTS